MNSEAGKVIIAALVGVIATGTVFFHFVEGWGWIDAYFFTVVTLSTVGYGSLVPATPLGKIAATVLIFAGLGIFAAAIQHFSNITIASRLRRRRAEREKKHPTDNPD
ncbi:potassium channel family protein [Lutimaribacter sp. EGI FJ00015]|uniref:Potassium channel family protein n=1 Tax=Lutimaribacter degradans TaxID=2945989 RepID=A0ACC5ZS88_9RHOB|nr:potassium channel family protein [Lutimaribacter sp. EGI FJ00013]MCM2561176.1 potassium channel family protein [Lutimaribacter sp. EGI FJ00013]MCO0611875.1 potassium channel family protein [Lutimaribacter sp. EGI FJ00015]MCO0635004.1 potassium channel family protein [Lutimaribacter sp. EGI FJ00014]